MIKLCIRQCIRSYGRDLDVKTLTIIFGCALTAMITGDITGTAFLTCLALGGVADVTIGLSACILKCLRNKR